MKGNRFHFEIVGMFFCAILILSVAIASVQQSPVAFPYWLRMKIVSFFPQGWSFFTRDTREKDLDLFLVKNNKLVSVYTPTMSLENGVGLKRNQRLVFSEISQIAYKIPDSCWLEVKGDLNNVLKMKFRITEIENKISVKAVQGVAYLKIQDRLPWARARTRKKNSFNYSYRIAKVNVR